MLLEGRVCIVTGAASRRGIGLATARLFAEHGARVAILDLDAARASGAAAEIGPAHRGYACDVTDRERCLGVVSAILDDLGPADVLVNNAGITQPLRVMEIEPAHYDAVLDVNLRGTLHMSQAVIPHMRARRRGSIVNLSSVSAQRGGGVFGGPHYAAAKAGILGLAKAMARELGPDGVRVNCVAPGLIRTDITGGRMTDAMEAEVVRAIPLNRLGEASEVAGACLFLASDLSSYVTGAVLDVNGGLLIH
jgi:NAD(P)-dependent dehydrogenase (short-subunit alcohol dehydrogenase family)